MGPSCIESADYSDVRSREPRCRANRSLPLKFPDIILVSSASSDLFDGSQAAPTVDQFVPPGNRDDRIRRPAAVLAHEGVSLPVQTGNIVLAKGDFTSIRQ